jgi:hypothetical protein
MKSILPQELINSYLTTNYMVFNPELGICVDKINPELNELLINEEVREWAYITSVNPNSTMLSVEQNQRLFRELKKSVKDYKTYEGHGAGSDPGWQPEISLLILGITRKEAIRLGNYYKQNAIVAGTLDNPAELILLV